MPKELKRPPRKFQTVEKAVRMTPAQQNMQTDQIAWLKLAIEAQNRKRVVELDQKSLRKSDT